MRKFFVNSLIALALLAPAFVLAQSKKIEFDQIPVSRALSRAAQTDKVVFIDCYTTWCIPCKNMATYVFTVDSVANYFNSHFVNLQIDMEKGEGPVLKERYKVEAYPSFLLLRPDGSLLYKFVGGMSAGEFLAKVREGMSPHNQVAEMNKRYESGDRKPAFIREYIKLKLRLLELSDGLKIATAYTNSLTDAEKVKPENWFLYGENRYADYLCNVHKPNFTYLADHWKAFTAYTDKHEVESKLKTLYRRVAEYCLIGNYFSDALKNVYPYQPQEFTRFREQLRGMDWSDKQEYINMMDVAEACGQRDTLKVTSLLAKYFNGFSADNQKLMYDYWLAYNRPNVRNGAFGFRPLLDTVAMHAKDVRLKNFAEGLKNR